jgi:flagellum-specific ATP synthase
MDKSELTLDFDKYYQLLGSQHFTRDSGKVLEVTGLVIKASLPGASVGSIVEVQPQGLENSFWAEVIGFKDRNVLMMPLGPMQGVSYGSRVTLAKQVATVRIGNNILGRTIDGLGQPIDGLGVMEQPRELPLYKEVRNPLDRRPIRESLDLGIRSINAGLTVGRGQRIGIMAGSGVGKSVLLGMMARYTEADINVIALIGERGRELREFIEDDLGPEGLKKSVIVVATSDQGPLIRMRGAYVAMAIAEHFCSLGKNVLFMMDSVTRFAMAQREVGLSIGEPPASKGYTPSVFSMLPKLLERAGSFEGEGSITGLYTVLVEGDDMDDPIGDSVRSIVDGHFVLSRKLAQQGHFPAVDILQSASRVMRNVTDRHHQEMARELREVLATHREAEDLINIGAYRQGANPKIDRAVRLIDPLTQFLRQRVEEKTNFMDTLRSLQSILHG